MHVLMHTRADWKELPGGDYVQLQRWTFWLRTMGIHVEVSDVVEPDLRGVDVVHLNNLGRAAALWSTVQHCRRFGVPMLLTTLYWPPEEYETCGRPGVSGRLWGLLPGGVRERMKTAVRWSRLPWRSGLGQGLRRELWHGSHALAQRVASAVDGLVAVSHAEAAALERLLPNPPTIYTVPSGVDALYWSDDRALWAREQGVERLEVVEESAQRRDGILCVARFDPQKGQHRLIEALRPLRTSLTLVGANNPNYPGYRAFCQKLAGPNTTLLPRQSLGQLRTLFRRCRLHALVSWYELSGLSALEAGACGARVVTTARGGMRDYCGDLAWYADPADLTDIRRQVEAALTAAETPDLAGHVRRHFTWERSARTLVEVYGHVLAARTRAAA